MSSSRCSEDASGTICGIIVAYPPAKPRAVQVVPPPLMILFDARPRGGLIFERPAICARMANQGGLASRDPGKS